MKKELRKNFSVVVKLLDKMQRSVLVEKKGYFGSNQIKFVRNIDMACGSLEEAVDAIFEDCKDVVEKKEDVVMTLRDGYDDFLYSTFRDDRECKPRTLCFEFDCGEKEGRKIYNIIVRFDELSDSIFVYVRRWYMRNERTTGNHHYDTYYMCSDCNKQDYFKNWIYSWEEKRWVDLKCNGHTYNQKEPVLEEPVFKMISLE